MKSRATTSRLYGGAFDVRLPKHTKKKLEAFFERCAAVGGALASAANGGAAAFIQRTHRSHVNKRAPARYFNGTRK